MTEGKISKDTLKHGDKVFIKSSKIPVVFVDVSVSSRDTAVVEIETLTSMGYGQAMAITTTLSFVPFNNLVKEL